MRSSLCSFSVFAVVACSAALGLAQTPATPPAQANPQLVQRNPTDVPPPAHPATPEQIREYLQLTDSVENAHRAFSQIIANSKRQAPPYLPADFWQDVEHSFAGIDVTAELTPIYQRYFSQEDMAAALTFYKTPMGQRVLKDQPIAAAAAGDVLRRDGARVGQEVFARHKDEIEAAQKAAQGGTAPSQTPGAPPKPTLSSPGDKPAAPQN